MKILNGAYESNYQSLKLAYIAKMFAKDFKMKLEDSSMMTGSPSFRDNSQIQLNVYQIVPECMHGSIFFKSVKNLLRNGSRYFSNALIRQTLFMILNVE